MEFQNKKFKNIIFRRSTVTILLGTNTLTTLTANSMIKIDVSPIYIFVNGELFKQKNTNNKDVLIFTYNSTTYDISRCFGLTVSDSKPLITIKITNLLIILNLFYK